MPLSRDVTMRPSVLMPAFLSASMTRRAPFISFPVDFSRSESSGRHVELIRTPSHVERLPNVFFMVRSDSTRRWMLVKLAGADSVLYRPGGDLRSRADAQLVADTFDVALGGPFGDEKPLGDLAVGHAVGDHRDHLALPAAQRARLQNMLGVGAALLQRVLQRPCRVHGLTVAPGAIGTARPKPTSGRQIRFAKLVEPEGSRAQRPFARYAVGDRLQAQRALVIAARG